MAEEGRRGAEIIGIIIIIYENGYVPVDYRLGTWTVLLTWTPPSNNCLELAGGTGGTR